MIIFILIGYEQTATDVNTSHGLDCSGFVRSVYSSLRKEGPCISDP
jgi:cell wall-associated NlpC family hydrolase